MTDTAILEIGLDALWLATKLAGPTLAVTLSVGLAISLLQAVTQVQEVTLTFVPKFLGVAAVMALSGSWMLAEVTTFTRELFAMVPQLLS